MYCSDDSSGQTVVVVCYIVKIAEIHVGKMQYRARRAGQERATTLEQDARHDDFKKIEG